MNAERTAAIARGVEFLLARQAEDGGWKKSRYGALRGGAATTAMIVRAITAVGPAARLTLRRQLVAATEFLRRGFARRGCVACPDGTLDLPVYATSLALLSNYDDLPLWKDEERERMVRWLRGQQLTEQRGFTRDDMQFGGWDLGAEPPPRGVTTGANLSLTAHALEALASAAAKDATEDDENVALFADATRWLDRCQRWPGDGGFLFAPNTQYFEAKGELDESGRPASYESATCDGLLARLSCRTDHDTPAVKATVEWLGKRAAIDERDEEQRNDVGNAAAWRRGLWFYTAARRTAAMNRLLASVSAERKDIERKWRDETLAALLRKQRADGGWSNDSAAMREDDPLVATPLALLALSGLD